MQLVTRDVTDGEGTKGLETEFDVAVPPDALLEVLWSPDHFARLYPDVKECRVLRTEESALEISYRVDAVVREVTYVLRRTLDRAARTIAWRELRGDLRRVRGGWKLSPGAGDHGAHATYSAFVDVGRFVPTALVRDGAKRKLGEMVERIRRVAVEIHRAPR
jgi:ribosome-associated toxin RatA of RatAB toxin-antitoxin module